MAQWLAHFPILYLAGDQCLIICNAKTISFEVPMGESVYSYTMSIIQILLAKPYKSRILMLIHIKRQFLAVKI
jgi:hypothetical protein